MKLVVTYGCISMGKDLYRTGDSFELPDDEAEKLMKRADEQVIALAETTVEHVDDNATADNTKESDVELPKADAAAAVQK